MESNEGTTHQSHIFSGVQRLKTVEQCERQG